MTTTEQESKEKVFFQDAQVTITQSRFVSTSTTYAMRNISSVTAYHIRKSRFWQIVLILVGICCVFADREALPWGVIMVLLGAIWLFFTRDTYSVRIRTNSGESDGFVSRNRQLIQKMVDAVNEAMIHRG